MISFVQGRKQFEKWGMGHIKARVLIISQKKGGGECPLHSDCCAPAFMAEELQMTISGAGDRGIFVLIKAMMKLV